MKAVFVEHPKFKAEMLHISELPESLVFAERPEDFGVMDVVCEIFQAALDSPATYAKFEDLTTHEAFECWRLYTAAKPYEVKVING